MSVKGECDCGRDLIPCVMCDGSVEDCAMCGGFGSISIDDPLDFDAPLGCLFVVRSPTKEEASW